MKLDIETVQGFREKFPEMSFAMAPALSVHRSLRRDGLGEMSREPWEIMEKGYFPNAEFEVSSVKVPYAGGVSLSFVQSQIIKMFGLKRRDGLGGFTESGISAQYKTLKNRQGIKSLAASIGKITSGMVNQQVLQRSVRIGKRPMRRNGLGERVPKTFEFEGWNL